MGIAETRPATLDVPILQMSGNRRWAVTIGVMTGMSLAALEATVIATAMPTVIAALGGMSHYSWVFSAYLVASTVTVPIWGKLSDLYGRRILYQSAVAVFLVGSVFSGLSSSMTQLIVSRIVQGIGAGGLVPLGMTIIGDIFTLRERARMQGLFSGVWGVASVVGPLVGGFLTDQLSWRWVFYINVPFGLAAATIIGLSLREPVRTTRVRIDYAGAVTLTASVTMLMLALVESGSLAALASPRNVALLGGAAVLGVVFVWIESRTAEPIVPLGLFRNRVVSVAVIAGFLAGIAMFGAITFVPLFAQGSRGVSATEAGSLLTPLMLAWVSMSVVGGRLLLRIGYRSMVLAGLALLAAAFAVFSTFGRTTPQVWLVLDLVVMGSGLGLTMLTLLLAVQHSVPRAQLGIATSLNQFFRTIGGAVGVAVMGAILSVSLAANLREAAERNEGGLTTQRAAQLAHNPSALIDPSAREDLTQAGLDTLQVSLAAALQNVFLLGSVLSAVALIAAFWLPRGGLHATMQADGDQGERMMMAELTTIDAAHEPDSQHDDS